MGIFVYICVMIYFLIQCLIFTCSRRFGMYYLEEEKFVSLSDEIKKLSKIFLWSIPLMLVTNIVINFLLKSWVNLQEPTKPKTQSQFGLTILISSKMVQSQSRESIRNLNLLRKKGNKKKKWNLLNFFCWRKSRN